MTLLEGWMPEHRRAIDKVWLIGIPLLSARIFGRLAAERPGGVKHLKVLENLL